MTIQFQKASRKKQKLRLALMGVAGSGKTHSALMIAKGIGGRVAVIDTEHGSAELFCDLVPFDVLQIEAPFDPMRAIEAMRAAAAAGYDIVILDSISHYWQGEGGLLDKNTARASSSRTGNSFMSWRETGKEQNQFVEAMLSYPGHVIATLRLKPEYVVEVNDKGKSVPRKIGLAPIQREGLEYEFTTVLDIINAEKHLAVSTKDRTRLFKTEEGEMITEATGKRLLAWLNEGEEMQLPAPTQQQFDAMLSYIAKGDTATVKKALAKYQLSPTQHDVIVAAIQAKESEKQTPPPTPPAPPTAIDPVARDAAQEAQAAAVGESFEQPKDRKPADMKLVMRIRELARAIYGDLDGAELTEKVKEDNMFLVMRDLTPQGIEQDMAEMLLRSLEERVAIDKEIDVQP